MKHFFTLLLVLAVAAPALRAAAQLPPGVARVSDRIEEATVSDSAPALMTPMADDNVTYTAWEDLGMASWDDNTWNAFVHSNIFSGENHFMVQMRSQTADPDMIQLKLVAVFGGSDFIIDANRRTYECSAARQATNIDCTSVENHEIDFFDAAITDSWTYGSPWALCSVAGGRLIFQLGMYYGSHKYLYKANCMITLDDAPQYSYNISGRHVFGKDETSATFDLTLSGDIDHVKYILSYDGVYMFPDKAFTEMADQLKSAKNTFTVPLTTGCWALYLYPCDAEGNWLGINSDDRLIWTHGYHPVHSNLADNYEWIDYGIATVHEGVIRDIAYNIPSSVPSEFYCNVLTRKDAPGKFLRLVNPYGPQSAVTSELLKEDNWRFSLPDEEFYLDINLEDPEQPYVIDRPMGPEYWSVDQPNNDGWIPTGSHVYPIHRLLLEGDDPTTIIFPIYKWNRLMLGQYYSLEIMFDQHLLLTDNSIDEDMTLTLYPTGNVDYVKYTFATTEDGMEIADKIAAGDPSVTVYTASVTESAKPASRTAGGKAITIKVPADIAEGARLIAVPYTLQGDLSGTYLDREIELWHNIGEAVIDGYLTGAMNPSVQCQRYASSMKFRLVNPSNLPDASKYFYIDATDPDDVNLSSDGSQGDFHTGIYLSGYSQTRDIYINTVANLIRKGILNQYTKFIPPVLNNRTVTIDDLSLGMIAYKADESGPNIYYFGSGTITLPEFTDTSAVDTVIPDPVVDENAPVEYYNLQGMKIANPGPGLYIRVQGSKAEKILIR